jgi:hypothetical protein
MEVFQHYEQFFNSRWSWKCLNGSMGNSTGSIVKTKDWQSDRYEICPIQLTVQFNETSNKKSLTTEHLTGSKENEKTKTTISLEIRYFGPGLLFYKSLGKSGSASYSWSFIFIPAAFTFLPKFECSDEQGASQ